MEERNEMDPDSAWSHRGADCRDSDYWFNDAERAHRVEDCRDQPTARSVVGDDYGLRGLPTVADGC